MAYRVDALAALADPTRRKIFERLAAAPQPVSELAKALPVSRPAVSQHLQVLKSAGLVSDRTQGTRRIYEIDPAGLGQIRRWLDQLWDRSLASFQAEVEQLEESSTMDLTVAPAPVRRSVRVNSSPARAFEVFTTGMTRWWLKSHSISSSPQKEVIIEPRPGGRWFERGEDGSECEWGRVLVWEPPARLVLTWQITADWRFDPDLVTEVEVRFAPDGPQTLIELEHKHLDRYGDKADHMRAILDSPKGWSGLLERFSAEVFQAS